MYKSALNLIKIVWGIVVFIVFIKILIMNSDTLGNIPQKIWDKVTSIQFNTIYQENIRLPLVEIYGMTIDGVSLCNNDYKSIRKDVASMPLVSSLSSSCRNGDCKVSVVYKEKIPSKIKLNVKLLYSNHCRLATYNTSNTSKVVGYKVKLMMTDEIKEAIGFKNEDTKIRFKHDTGFTHSKIDDIDVMTFDFDALRKNDVLIVDDEAKITMEFELK